MEDKSYDASMNCCYCFPCSTNRVSLTKTHVHLRTRERRYVCCGWVTRHEHIERNAAGAYIDTPGLRGLDWLYNVCFKCTFDQHHYFVIKGSDHELFAYVDLSDKHDFRAKLQQFMEE